MAASTEDDDDDDDDATDVGVVSDTDTGDCIG